MYKAAETESRCPHLKKQKKKLLARQAICNFAINFFSK